MGTVHQLPGTRAAEDPLRDELIWWAERTLEQAHAYKRRIDAGSIYARHILLAFGTRDSVYPDLQAMLTRLREGKDTL